MFKRIALNHYVCSCKFSNDSKLFYVGTDSILYQYSVERKFKKVCKLNIHNDYIINIICISNTIVLTASLDHTIVKTNINNF